MKNKFKRQDAIIRLIKAGSAANQDALLLLLRAEGFQCTQATLSRDLHEIRAVKIPSEDKGYIYTLVPGEKVNSVKNTRISYLADGFRDWKLSGNMLVIRTLPGFASSIALAIDNAQIPGFLGTIAGDDTIFAVLKENVTYEELKHVLIKTLPFIRNKI